MFTTRGSYLGGWIDERPGEIVTREALRARLWPGGTFVNYDANVNTSVNKLRLALGDSPEKPMYGRYRDRDIASRATSSVAPAC